MISQLRQINQPRENRNGNHTGKARRAQKEIVEALPSFTDQHPDAAGVMAESSATENDRAKSGGRLPTS